MNAAEFYDKLAAEYHLIFGGNPSNAQGDVIERLLQAQLKSSGPFKILDCTCGIGTQALELARRGHSVTGTDISPGAIQRAQSEAVRLGVKPHLEVADMRSLENIEGPFDAVISFDNSLAHLNSDSDLAFALSSVLAVLRPGGVFLASLRDYDTLKKERPTGTIPRHMMDNYGERVYVQTWDWSEDGKNYDLRFFVLKRGGENWTAKPLEIKMRAYTRGEIVGEIEKTPGFASSEWFFSNTTGFYQPILVAKKS